MSRKSGNANPRETVRHLYGWISFRCSTSGPETADLAPVLSRRASTPPAVPAPSSPSAADGFTFRFALGSRSSRKAETRRSRTGPGQGGHLGMRSSTPPQRGTLEGPRLNAASGGGGSRLRGSSPRTSPATGSNNNSSSSSSSSSSSRSRRHGRRRRRLGNGTSPPPPPPTPKIPPRRRRGRGPPLTPSPGRRARS